MTTDLVLPTLPDRYSLTPTDPTCPGTRHGNPSSYRRYGCKCPEVMAYYRIYRQLRYQRRLDRVAAGLEPAPVRRPPVDQGDVDAAVAAAMRWRPVPWLTRPERVAVAHRLRVLGEGGAMPAEEIGRRMGRCSRTVERYLSMTVDQAIESRAKGATPRYQPRPLLVLAA